MFNVTRHLSLGLAVLAVAGTAFAGPQAKSASTHPNAAQSAKSVAGKSKASAPTTLAATGKIVSFDPAAQSLTLSTSKGQEQFTLESSTRLRDSSHAIAPADLAGLTGRQATVRYHESSGQKTVVSVRVAGGGKTSAKD
ncbi:MAG TPA: hypothetical protein VH740_20620 [Vicinamibacterales bacterium]|jgi:hypothetical protein